MLKAVGAGIVLVSCTGIGFRIARNFRERPRQLRAVLHALRVLQAEVEYSATPLPFALRKVADRSQAPVQTLFERAAEALHDNERSVAEAIDEGIRACEAQSSLRTQDFEVLREFGKTLGQSDRQHQTQQIEVAISRLSGLEREARDSQQRHERLWQYVGVLMGLMLVVLLY
ncbi:stage III sporulation protein SpoIIIAB [Alicyclobacillus pomorum]|jgi:stage III sporulation protein AB|uniref:stage III sporulation protein SpoIIIAB n=1 Tax=Alicyclobacillus pomorum TaxID=204470 RepID=UPI0004097373|nr:stage III sporulation protein SpoIIIAB [Alicyclobacillus pomorum]